MKYRLKSNGKIYDCYQYDGSNAHILYKWSNGCIIESPVCEPTDDNPTGAYVQIKNKITSETIARVGEWIVKEDGDLYLSFPDSYIKTYFKPINKSRQHFTQSFSNKYLASRYFNQGLFLTNPKDFAKASCLYNEYNRIMRQRLDSYILTLIYKDFCNRVEDTKWSKVETKTHLLNIFHAIHVESTKIKLK